MALRSIGIVRHFTGSLAQAVTRTRSKVCVLRGGGAAGEFHLRPDSVYVAVVLNSKSECVWKGSRRGGGTSIHVFSLFNSRVKCVEKGGEPLFMSLNPCIYATFSSVNFWGQLGGGGLHFRLKIRVCLCSRCSRLLNTRVGAVKREASV